MFPSQMPQKNAATLCHVCVIFRLKVLGLAHIAIPAKCFCLGTGSGSKDLIEHHGQVLRMYFIDPQPEPEVNRVDTSPLTTCGKLSSCDEANGRGCFGLRIYQHKMRSIPSLDVSGIELVQPRTIYNLHTLHSTCMLSSAMPTD